MKAKPTVEEEKASLQTFNDNYTEQYGFHDETLPTFKSAKGLTQETIELISARKKEPQWMLDIRLKAYSEFLAHSLPPWMSPAMDDLDFDDIHYYVEASDAPSQKNWDDVPADIKKTFDRLGIPEAEQKFLSGAGAQYDSTSFYHNIEQSLAAQNVIFCDMDTAVREYPDIVRKYWGTVIPSNDNKLAALNTAVWSGGCLTEQARVFTSRGLISIKDIVSGDEVISWNKDTNRLTSDRVVAQIASGPKPVSRIRVGGREIEASDNHKFLALRKSQERLNKNGKKWFNEWVELKDLQMGDIIAIAKTAPIKAESRELPAFAPYLKNNGHWNKLKSPAKTSVELMWLLGLYVGDGHIFNIKHKTGAINFALPDGNKGYIREQAIKYLESLFNITPKRGSFQVSCHALAKWIHALGFTGLAKTKRVPEWVYALPYDEKMALLAGIVDADGSIENDGKIITVELCNRELVEDIKMLAISCGLFTNGKIRTRTRQAAFYKAEERYIVNGTSYTCRLTGAINKVPCKAPHKKEKLLSAKHYTEDKYNTTTGMNFSSMTNDNVGYAPITDKEDLGVKETYDIQVAEHCNFISNGIITHNSFLFVPEGVHVDMPLQAYFRMNTESMGQFERTMIVTEEGASVTYIEGCSAAVYTSSSLHAAVVELVAHRHSKISYTTIQNWAGGEHGVYNLVTKRAVAYEHAEVSWVDANVGCISEGTHIPTRLGLKNIEDICVGDEVISYDDVAKEMVFKPVTAKRFSGEQPVREVAIGERKILATDNHPFYSYTHHPNRGCKLGRYDMEYVRTDQLTHAIYPVSLPDYGEAYQLYVPPTEIESVFENSNQYGAHFTVTRKRQTGLTLPSHTNTDIMWLFGCFLGDGDSCIKLTAKGKPRWGKVSFSVPVNNRAHPKLTRIMSSLSANKPTVRKDGIYSSWNSLELLYFFNENGFTTGAYAKRLPEWTYSLPREQRLALLAGYMDSDGGVKGNEISIKSANKPLLEDVARLISGLGWTSRIHTEYDVAHQRIVVGRECTARESHRLSLLYFPYMEDLLSHTSSGYQQQFAEAFSRKTTLRKQIGRSNLRLSDCLEVQPVKVSEPKAAVPTWDIEVAGTGNFVAEGFLVHNSTLTTKFPSVYLLGEGAHGEVLSMAFAGRHQHQDTGGKIVHAAPNTTSNIFAKSISKDGGRSTYRGLLEVAANAHGSTSTVVCDALLLDEHSRTDTYPTIRIGNPDSNIGHEATVSKVGDEQMFYLMSHGIDEQEAMKMIVNGFIEPVVKHFDFEYAVEINRLIELEMEGSIG